MSLESQVAALVSAANKLTSEIAGKMKGIDQKVDQAVQVVPETVRSTMDMETYVHPTRGDDANDGSRSNPLKTVMAALKKGFNGVSHRIYLYGGFEYLIDDNLSFHGQLIEIAPVNPDSLSETTRPVIKFSELSSSPGVRVAFMTLSSTSIVLRSLEIKHPYQSVQEGALYANETRYDVMFNLTRKSMLYTGYAGSYSSRNLTIINLGDNLPKGAPMPRICVSADGMNDIQLTDTRVTGKTGCVVFNRRGGATYARVSDGGLDEGVTLIPAGYENTADIIRSSYFL
ncbi:hypothetical protein [Vreelandella sp. TE19]